jgi:hypothetical protein
MKEMSEKYLNKCSRNIVGFVCATSHEAELEEKILDSPAGCEISGEATDRIAFC